MVRVPKMRRERDHHEAELRERMRRQSRRVRRALKEGPVEVLGTKPQPAWQGVR